MIFPIFFLKILKLLPLYQEEESKPAETKLQVLFPGFSLNEYVSKCILALDKASSTVFPVQSKVLVEGTKSVLEKHSFSSVTLE